MTDYGAVVAAIVSLASLLAIWFAVFWLYRDFCVDAFRQKMFSLRDQLFDDAEAGLLPFAHPAYGLLRSTMNGFIRFAHRLGLLQVIITGWLVRSRDGESAFSFERAWEEANRELAPEQRQRLDAYILRMNYLVVSYVVLSSPILMVTLVIPLVFWFLARVSLQRILTFARKPLDEVDSAALTYGSS